MQPEQKTYDDNMRLRALSAGLQDKNISILHQTLDLAYDLAENLHPSWPAQSILGKSDIDLLPEALADQLSTAKTLVLSSGETNTIEVELRDGASRKLFEVRVSPDRDARGIIFGLFTILTDVTELRGRELALTNLLREVSHRSKNLLAIVQSVAMQTAHHSDSIDSFLQKFRGRLHALSSTQDLVTESNWRGTLFQSLVTAQLARVGQTSLEAIRITGDNPMLGPNSALHIGLAIHELATNAVLHGALSGGDDHGAIWISAAVEASADPAQLIVEWRESGLPRSAASAPRFGTMVLERIVPLSVGGTATYDVKPDTVSYRLTVPADQFET
jgi:two-component sensor histidine kinase